MLVLGLLFLHPQYIRALDAKQNSLSGHSFEKAEQGNLAFYDDSQKPNAVSDADVDIDDDEDGSFSARKKISFESISFLDSVQYSVHHFSDNSRKKICCYTPFYHFPYSHFISLRVFRL
jgi:hypothetical protein